MLTPYLIPHPCKRGMGYVGGNEARKDNQNNSRLSRNDHGSSSGNHTSNKFILEPYSTSYMRTTVRRSSRQSEIHSQIADFEWRLRYARKIVPISGILTIIVLLLAWAAAYVEWVIR